MQNIQILAWPDSKSQRVTAWIFNFWQKRDTLIYSLWFHSGYKLIWRWWSLLSLCWSSCFVVIRRLRAGSHIIVLLVKSSHCIFEDFLLVASLKLSLCSGFKMKSLMPRVKFLNSHWSNLRSQTQNFHHQANLYFLKPNDLYFHMGYAEKSKLSPL